MATEKQIKQVLLPIASDWPELTNTPERAKAFRLNLKFKAKMLADLDIDLIRAAALQCAAESKWFPRVAEIRAKALELTRDPSIPTAFEAWEEVAREAHYGTTDFSHPLIGEAVKQIGGMKQLGMAWNKDMVSHRARFLECYGVLEQRGDRDRAMLPGVRAVAERMALPK